MTGREHRRHVVVSRSQPRARPTAVAPARMRSKRDLDSFKCLRGDGAWLSGAAAASASASPVSVRPARDDQAVPG